ncbi:MAG: hypothetical protein R3305_11680 [Gammaproteobacteria bacterium]|nr:hypothetical protein [Gammaproteobacteria bacterium]
MRARSRRNFVRAAAPRALITIALAAIFIGSTALAQDRERPERINGKPNLNGIWQAMNTAHWNLEGHSAEALDEFWQLGAIAAIPAGQSVVVGGTIPYLPEALAKREENRAGWPASDPEAKCYMPGIPRATYMPYPFQIVQGEGDVILFSYTFANANRPVYMTDHQIAPVDLWMGRSNGSWDGDTLVIEVNSNIDQTWLDRAGNHHSYAMIVTERYTLIDEHVMQYEATIEDPETFSRPWTIRMPLYRRIEDNARLLEFNCVEFAEQLLYGDLMTGAPLPGTE